MTEPQKRRRPRYLPPAWCPTCLRRIGQNRNAFALDRLLGLSFSRALDKFAPVIQEIWAGGQTGADEAGLRFALEHRIKHGGYCPKGRIREDGVIPACFKLKETKTSAYPERTRKNVKETDATIIFSFEAQLTGGSFVTRRTALEAGKPALLIHRGTKDPAIRIREFLRTNDVKILNIAGQRESKSPGICAWVQAILEQALSPEK